MEQSQIQLSLNQMMRTQPVMVSGLELSFMVILRHLLVNQNCLIFALPMVGMAIGRKVLWLCIINRLAFLVLIVQ